MASIENVNTASQVAGLRALADLIETHPEIGAGMAYELDDIRIYGMGPDARSYLANLVTAVRNRPFTVGKNYSNSYLDVSLSVGKGGPFETADGRYAFGVTFCAPRASVCTPTVVRTETVEVPDYSVKMPARPTTTVERDVIEWECHPLLGE